MIGSYDESNDTYLIRVHGTLMRELAAAWSEPVQVRADLDSAMLTFRRVEAALPVRRVEADESV